MSMRICVDEYFTSDLSGLSLGESAVGRSVTASRFESAADGELKRSSEPVTMIEGTVSWRNNTGVDQYVVLLLHFAPRKTVTSNPNAVSISDSWGYDVGSSPRVDAPDHLLGDVFARYRLNDWSDAGFAYGTRFYDFPDRQLWPHIGVVPAGQAVSAIARTQTAIQDPWREPSASYFESYAYWLRMQLWAWPDVIGA